MTINNEFTIYLEWPRVTPRDLYLLWTTVQLKRRWPLTIERTINIYMTMYVLGVSVCYFNECITPIHQWSNNILHTMNKLLCTLYSMYDVHCTAYNVCCTLYNAQCTMYSFHYTSRYANEYMCPYTMLCNNNSSSMSPFETQTISQHCYWITRIIYCADNTSYIYIYLANCNNMLLIQLTVIVWWPWTHLCPYIIRYKVHTPRTKLSVTPCIF